ncbi:sulfurtransferase [Pontibacillus yanchengensis]|uniref:3-mercaptopyruvate sulfurtransferase n=1 Tax=Pontibacillus yanchengensis Y32 TaxID=1385514 RepID=A0A0A2T5M6_9BACI|nr:sulfurtransferase [Pontibacillus yanchengensis]KGP71107.1 3-mercaptopyruvate sulfurtransferase [Pontibacillus yanchengensis Y32]
MGIIISVDQVKKLQGTREVQFIDCRFNLQDPLEGSREFNKAHLPGAVYFDLEKDLSGTASNGGGRHPFPNKEHLVHKLEQYGITKDTTLIAYDNPKSPTAARFYWFMKVLGHDEVYILDGGFQAWESSGYSVSSEPPTKVASTYEVKLKNELLATQAEVQSSLEDLDVGIVDARSFERFAGWKEPKDEKAGHIPSAANYEWTKVFDQQGFWKTTQELQELFSPLNEMDSFIVYCGSGVTAAPLAVALREANFPKVKLYVGSWSDWISNEDNPIHVIPDS